MNRDTIKQIMIDQKEMYLNNPLIERHYILEENVNYCFVGIRRTGKACGKGNFSQVLLHGHRSFEAYAP